MPGDGRVFDRATFSAQFGSFNRCERLCSRFWSIIMFTIKISVVISRCRRPLSPVFFRDFYNVPKFIQFSFSRTLSYGLEKKDVRSIRRGNIEY